MTRRGLRRLKKPLAKHPTLTSLNASRASGTRHALAPLAPPPCPFAAVAHTCPCVVYRRSAGNTGGATLAPLPKYNTTLQELNLSHTHLGDAGGMVLARSLADNTTVHTVRINGTPLV